MPGFPSGGRRALRLGRASIPGQVYLLATTAYRRRRLFTNPPQARAMCGVIHAAPTWGDARLRAWVLMPDHWHGLLELGNEPLGRGMNCFKANASRALHSIQGGGVDGSGIADHALRADEDVLHAARYIVANPVRAGLVKRVLDYPCWNAVWLDADASSR